MDHLPSAQRSSKRTVRGLLAFGTLLIMLTLPLSATGEPTPSGAPTPAPTPESSPVPSRDSSPEGTPEATPPSPTPAPGPSSTPGGTPAPTGAPAPTPEPSPAPQREQQLAGESALPSLAVAAGDTPVPGRFFEDIGRYLFSGTVGADNGTATVGLYRREAAGGAWSRIATPRADPGGTFAASLPVQARGSFLFAATLGGAPGAAGSVSSPPVAVTVENSSIALTAPARSIDSLKDLAVAGRVNPARAGVAVVIEIETSGGYAVAARATTDPAGSYRALVGYGRSQLKTYRIRSSYRAANRDRTEASTTHSFQRIAVINAVVTKTTAEEVAKTYRKGCPVGPSKLRTITMNFYGRDKRIHRGLIIVGSDLTGEIIRGFDRALTRRFPVAKLNNPNVYGGNDPKQMEANNTSGFNCRKVVGNPYRMSPHSYGIAIDVNPVQNPYRDPQGTWWPANGKSYIDRAPRRFGMLTKYSNLTKSLRSDDFFWGGFWYPGRDYQHFEYRP